MFCHICGTKLDDASLFCGNCGTRVVAQTPVVIPKAETPVYEAPAAPAEEAPAYIPSQQETPAAPVEEAPAYVPPQQETPAAPVEEAPAYVPPQQETPAAPAYDPYQPYTAPAAAAPKKKPPILALLGIILAVLVVGVVVAGFLTDWFGLAGPMVKIVSAANKTLNAESFTMTISTPETDIIAQVAMDLDKHDITLVAYPEGKEDEAIAIYDGYLIMGNGGSYYAQDISDVLDKIFDAYEDAKDEKFSLDDLIDALDDLGALEGIDEDELEGCIKTYAKKLNSSSWLKKNAGFSKGRQDGATAYTFEPDLQEFLTASLEIFEPAFEDEDYYEELAERLEDLDGEEVPYFKMSFLVKSGKLTGIIMDIGEDEWIDIIYEDIGKADIDYDWLDQMLDEAEISPFQDFSF